MERVEIWVAGRIDKHWSDCFADLEIAYEAHQTIRTDAVADAAALYGLLAKLRDFGRAFPRQ